jgi:hypothetical protein
MPDHDRILYRLIDAHPRYGSEGRSYEYEQWTKFPYYDKALFEKVNTGLTDYILNEIQNGSTTETYLVD